MFIHEKVVQVLSGQLKSPVELRVADLPSEQEYLSVEEGATEEIMHSIGIISTDCVGVSSEYGPISICSFQISCHLFRQFFQCLSLNTGIKC